MTTPSDTRPPLDITALTAPSAVPEPFTVEVRDAVGSTSSVLGDMAREGAPEGTVLVAEHQTAGRGRMGRDWQTPPRAALTFSVLLRPGAAPERWPLLPLLTGLAVVEGIAESGGPPVVLKWPNDVLVREGLKVAGLLAERIDTPQGPAAVVGVGVNVSTTRAELPVETAASLVTAGAVAPDRTELLVAILASLARRYDAWRAEPGADAALLEEYAARCDTVGREVEVRLPGERTLRGRATGIGGTGALVVVDEQGPHEVHAGDVVHLRVP